MIRIRIERKRYAVPTSRENPAVIENLALDLGHGEFVCLVGPSGCGKTTLLNIVAGLDRAFDGCIDFGADAGDRPHTAYVFQEPRLLPWRSVRQNVELAQPKGKIDREHIDHLLEVLGLSHAQHQYPERLSLGMSRRAALARAFAVRPALLLMDEPFVSLDAATSRRIRELLLAVWRERPHTVLFVTHDVREAIALADRLVFLNAHPMSIRQEIDVTEPRAARTGAWVETFRAQLADDYPAIRHML
ncbi:ATP-binding cassette domain-containing protein [Methylococcus sp. ANG]|uniref:ABC transporter ATP-binding protein n=1 Tax=Methylococcus sp. ANG TaxID=3231903 RepID=UPI0034598C64